MRALASLSAFVLCWSALADPPTILIVQYRVDVTDRTDANYAIGNLLAEQLDIEGKVRPIVWTLSDKIFREAVDSGLLGAYNPVPSTDEVDAAAKKLKASYIFITTAKQDGGSLDTAAQLYHNKIGKPIWSDKKVLGVMGPGGVDWDNTARSITNTWALLLSAGPLKKLRSQPRLFTPPPEKGMTSATADPTPSKPVADPIKQATDLVAKGFIAEAIGALRSSIDDDPFEPNRREALVRLLLDRNLYQEAAQEARSAIVLAPSHGGLRLLAARAWLRQGRLEEAQNDLNEALARNVDDPFVQLLLGELALERSEPEKAIEPYQNALAKEDSFEARLGLGISFGLTGNTRGAADAFNNPPKASEETHLDGYRRAIRFIDAALDKLASELRSSMQQANIKAPGEAEIAQSERTLRIAQSLSALVAALPAPKTHGRSHPRRDLAHKLLVQAAEQALSFAKSGDEDASGEALLSLSEAMKQISTIRTQFENEKIPGAVIDGS